MAAEFMAVKSEGLESPAFKEWVAANGAQFKELKEKGIALQSEFNDARDAADEAERLQRAADAESREAASAASTDSFMAEMDAVAASIAAMPTAIHAFDESEQQTVVEGSDEC